ncbi:hypothetical protein STCU_09049 [Strigomonas culicis]|uniref:Uncharacterized protein n=1 Tax=Strigomonas culicis TaxID=28005 RepID=S9VB80_9TRYP|nr:hypothetical protein STCU_09049 [Strigomonas culicis]|eukprot:EPY20325.1 hypothetical protein STCU_09049 [Strigomonas culicis]
MDFPIDTLVMTKDEPNVACDTESEELFYSELLDLIQSTNDAALLQSNESVVPDTPSGSPPTNSVKAPVIKPHFLVGGSLFAPRHVHQPNAGRDTVDFDANTRLFGAARYTNPLRRPHTLVGVLRRGSLFCPFTKQFFSLSSPHWQHLKLAGFAVDASMQNGRRVQLLYPRILYRLACQLQHTTPSFTQAGSRCLAVDSDRPLSNRGAAAPAAVYAQRGWSPALAHTLGALLERAPIGTFKAFHRSTVNLIQHESGVMFSRRIPFPEEPLLPPHTGASAPVAGSTSFCWRAHRPSFWRNETPLPLVELGHAFLRSAGQARRCVLQEDPKFLYDTSLSSRDVRVEREGPEDEREATLTSLLSPVASFLESPLIRLPGMPWHTRAAFFRIPFCGGGRTCSVVPASPMLSVCACLLRHFLSGAAQGVPLTGGYGDSSLFFCQVEHSVDYNSVLDLEACAISSEDAIERVEKSGSASLTPRVPMLSLGLEGDAGRSGAGAAAGASPAGRPRVVVVGNAHMLSRRALSRLLDQWTRNGAADGALRAAAAAPDTAGARAQWQLLMSMEPFTTCVRTHYAVPFGSVRILFVGLHFTPTAAGTQDSGGARGGPRAPLRLSVDAAPRESIFHLVEPLSAALLHASAVTPRMSHMQRVRLLQDLVRCAQTALGGQMELTAKFSQTLPSGRVLVSQRAHSLSTERGSLLLYEGCEALLSAAEQPTSSQHLESVLATYPFLSQLKCQHNLLSAYDVQLRSGDVAYAGAMPAASLDRLPSAQVALVLTSSRAETANRIANSLETLTRVARAAALSQVTQRASTRVDVPSVFRQTYTSFIEPPLLLGRWSPTFFFCAPLVADVIPLARHVLVELRRCCHCTHDGTLLSLRLLTVDVFHVDYILFSKAKRCRLFGLRVLYERRAPEGGLVRPTCETPGGRHACSAVAVYDDPHVKLSASIQALLKDCASSALFFPMWTYTVTSPSPTLEREGAVGAQQRNGDAPSGYTFGCVNEGCAPTVPNLVERRLFSLAATQHPALSLAVGCHVLLTSPIQHEDLAATEPPRVAVPAGSILRVTGFVSAAVLHDDARVPEPYRWHVAHLPATARAVASVFLEQQSEAGQLLPLVEWVHPPAEAGAACGPPAARAGPAAARRHYVLLPQPCHVGGYASLHYYTLPLLHLPVLLLEGGAAHDARRIVRRRENVSALPPCRPGPLSFCYSALELLHPYHSGPRSIAALLFRAKERLEVLHYLLEELAKGEERDVLRFTEDIPFAPHAESTYLQGADRTTEGELQARTPTPLLQVEQHERTSKCAFSCESMTELSLFPRYSSA